MDTVKSVCDTLFVSAENTPVQEGATIWFEWTLWLPLVFFLLCCVASIGLYFRYKHKYYHDLSKKTKPTYVWWQVGIVCCLLFVFLWCCAWCGMNGVPSDLLKWLAGAGVILTWMCQDVIKNIVAFITLMLNGVLHIKDWIIVEKYGIDGEVEEISLTSVVIKNWDNTTSVISTKSLLETNMQNLQKVSSGKTSGRRMMRNFLIDVHSVRTLSTDEISVLKNRLANMNNGIFVPAIEEAVKNGIMLNSSLFRMYLRNWMLSQETIFRTPKFAVRLLDPTPNGLPIQIYAYTSSVGWEEFELEQARITEHVLETIELFDLVLYQNQAGTDINKIYVTKEK